MSNFSVDDPTTKANTPVFPAIKGLYILAITAESLAHDVLRSVVQMADEMLRNKNPIFASLWEDHMQADTAKKIANIQFAGSLIHTPQTMQTALVGWLKQEHNIVCIPDLNYNFFPQGMRDPQGRENYFLFYFDLDV